MYESNRTRLAISSLGFVGGIHQARRARPLEHAEGSPQAPTYAHKHTRTHTHTHAYTHTHIHSGCKTPAWWELRSYIQFSGVSGGIACATDSTVPVGTQCVAYCPTDPNNNVTMTCKPDGFFDKDVNSILCCMFSFFGIFLFVSWLLCIRVCYVSRTAPRTPTIASR